MVRTEYYDDPDAPEPNSLVVGVSAVVVDDEGRILLQKRTDAVRRAAFHSLAAVLPVLTAAALVHGPVLPPSGGMV